MRPLLILLAFFALPASADVVVIRSTLPQQFTDEQARQVSTFRFRGYGENARYKQAFVLSQYSESVNSGVYNILSVKSVYVDGYLDSAEISFLPFKGEGNRLRLMIRIATEGDVPMERDFQHHRAMVEYLLKTHPDLVPIRADIATDGRPLETPKMPLCEEMFYLLPTWYDPNATLDSLTEKSEARLRAAASHN